jgi:hypothetical protein
MFLLRGLIWCWLLHPEAQGDPVIKIRFSPEKRVEDATADSLFYHPNRKITWADFKATPPSSRKSAAVSYTSFAYEGNSLRKKDTLVMNLTLQVFFIKSSSWATAYAMDAYGLAHEQLHFDITWLVALRFEQKIRKMELTLDDYDSIIQYQYLESFREMNSLQDAYDKETRHGQDAMAQQEWQRKVADALATIYSEGALTQTPIILYPLPAPLPAHAE